jgi:hypothetical protein
MEISGGTFKFGCYRLSGCICSTAAIPGVYLVIDLEYCHGDICCLGYLDQESLSIAQNR